MHIQLALGHSWRGRRFRVLREVTRGLSGGGAEFHISTLASFGVTNTTMARIIGGLSKYHLPIPQCYIPASEPHRKLLRELYADH